MKSGLKAGLIVTTSLIFLSGPGGNAQISPSPLILPSASPSLSPSPSTTFSPPAASSRQVYFTRLRPVNNSGVWGLTRIVVDNNSVGVQLRAYGLQSGMTHEQYVDSGNLCPNWNYDQNGDGYIDAVEGANATGLSGPALSFQDGTFPTPSEVGALNFIQSYSLAGFLTALTNPISSPTPTPSSNPTSNPTALPSASPTASPTIQPLPGPTITTTTQISAQNAAQTAAQTAGQSSAAMGVLSGMVVVIDGVNPNVTLPNSVQGLNGDTANATLPVACGRLYQILE